MWCHWHDSTGESQNQTFYTLLLGQTLYHLATEVVRWLHTGTPQLKVKHKVGVYEVITEVSVSAQDGIVALGRTHTRSNPSLNSLPKVALKAVPIFTRLNTDRSRLWRVAFQPLPFSTPLSFRRSELWCSGLSMFRKFLKPRSTSALPSCRSDMISAVLASRNHRRWIVTTSEVFALITRIQTMSKWGKKEKIHCLKWLSFKYSSDLQKL